MDGVTFDSRDTHRAGYIEALETAWAVVDDLVRADATPGRIRFELERLVFIARKVT